MNERPRACTPGRLLFHGPRFEAAEVDDLRDGAGVSEFAGQRCDVRVFDDAHFGRSCMIAHADLPPAQRSSYRMAMPLARDRTDWTVDELDALEDDGRRYEIIDGVLFVTPAPRDTHQFVVGEFAARLHEYLRTEKFGRMMTSPADVRRGDRTRNRVQPDVFVMRVVDGKRPFYPYEVHDLALIVEVLSRSSRRQDTGIKRDLYLREGAGEYWIVDPAARTVARWCVGADAADIFTDTIEWHLDGMRTTLHINLRELFEEALDW
jgi:Uma2 family endonuclease